jgi:type I restriction enzyme M protein
LWTNEHITQQLSGRVQELETRYAEPLPALEKETSELSDTVDEYLKMMGVA